MERIDLKNERNKLLSLNLFSNKDEFIISFKIRLKGRVISELFFKNYLYVIITFCIILFLILIFFLIFAKTKLFLEIFHEGKIFYKNEKELNLKMIKKQLKNYREQIKINFDETKDFIRRKKLKVSLIITLFNQENFLEYSYSSIQKQNLKDLEIIFLDDFSHDNSWKIIKKLMKKDKRIIYIKRI